MARRVVAPIVALSTAVAERRTALPLLDSANELGILARAFSAHTDELKEFFEREHFFAGDVSHELRTPLTIISGAAEIVAMDSDERPVSRAAAQRIYRAASDAALSVNTLLLLARSPELIESEAFMIGALLEDEVGHFQSLVAAKPVSLTFQGGVDFQVVASRQLVASAVGNLIRNACLYTEAGAIEVSMENHSVVVRDTGIGLPPAVVAMLGNQLSGSTLRGSEGTGLGLALVKRICRQLNATLNVVPNAGGGSAFFIIFPPS